MGTKSEIETRSILLLFPLCLFSACLATQDFLFFTSQGDAEHGPGIYGGPIDFRQNGAISTDMYMYGYNCVYHEGAPETDVEIDWFDIDEQSGHLLFRQYSETGLFTLMRGPTCHKRPHCRNDTQEALFSSAQLDPHKAVGAIADHHSVVYFIYYDVSTSGNQKKSKVELRKLTGCDSDFPITSSSTPSAASCSVLVAMIKEDTYDRAPHFNVLGSLVAYGSSGPPSFLFLLQESEINDGRRTKVDVVLTHVSPGGEVSFLHRRNVKELGYFFMELRGLGGVSLKDGKVCWAAVDTVLCGDLMTGGEKVSVNNVIEAMPSSQVASVCQAEGEPLLAYIVTGVALAETKKEIAFFFGCVSQLQGYGGAGLLRKPTGSQKGKVYALKNGTDFLYAGSMHLTDHCHYHPSQDTLETTLETNSSTGSDVRPVMALWLTTLWALSLACHRVGH